jgi:hypothetical protein
MSASSRVSIPSPPPIKLRKRAKTEALLGEDYKETVTEILESPKPLKDAGAYDEQRLKQGLKYADWALRNMERKLSPIGARGLMLYKEACARLLDLDEGKTCEEGEDTMQEVRDEYLGTIRIYERSIQFTACLRTTRTADAQSLQDELVKLQRLAFYARYGDILAAACRELKREAEAKKVEGWRTLNKKYWTDVHKTLADEKAVYEKVLNGEPLYDQCPTHFAISQACMTVGFSKDNMLSIIDHYARRNELLHSNMIPFIKNGMFHDLTKRLHDDFCDIPLVIMPLQEVQSELMVALLNTMIDHWFERDPDQPNNHQMWIPSANLKKLHKDLKGPKPPNEADLNKEISEIIVKGLKRRLRDAEKEKELVEQLNTSFGIAPGASKVKRVASSQLQAELERNKRMRIDWSKILNLVQGNKEISDVYLTKYGEFGVPADIVHDPSSMNEKAELGSSGMNEVVI